MQFLARPKIAEGWPARTDRAAGYPVEEGPAPGQGPLGGARWLYVWNRDPLGECCCWRGAQRQDSVGTRGSCQRPGKHPWITRKDGEPVGFVHGAADAVEYGELVGRYGPPGGARQLGVVLDGLLLVDLDSPRAVRDFARMSFTVPRERILAVATSPRGFHVWLDVPGWNQKALNTWMRDWLAPFGPWSGTEAGEAGRRGFLVDVRTGVNRYVVWPGSHPDRRWISRAEFGRTLAAALVGMPAWRMVTDPGGKAPWAVDTAGDWMAGWIAEHGGGGPGVSLEGLRFDGSDDELAYTWTELERWIARLEAMAPGGGRNNLLNVIAYVSGARCLAAGHPVGEVRQRLIQAGEGVGTHGVAATVDSGLGAGQRALWAAKKSAA